jgi:hypothetical protein
MSRRRAQHDHRFLNPKRKPLVPDFISLPETRRTEKRFVRAVVRDISRPKPLPALAPEPKPAMESVENLHDKLVRFGWITSSGQSLDWTHWNRYPKPYFRSEPQD